MSLYDEFPKPRFRLEIGKTAAARIFLNVTSVQKVQTKDRIQIELADGTAILYPWTGVEVFILTPMTNPC